MEQKLIKVPFDVEIAKRITNKECEGNIVTRDGKSARIICWNRVGAHGFVIVALVSLSNQLEKPIIVDVNGKYLEQCESDKDLILEIPEYMSFKDGDVLTTDEGYTFVLCLREDGGFSYYIGTTNCESAIVNLDAPNYLFVKNKQECRKATEEETHELIKRVEKIQHIKAKEYLKRFFGIEIQFKPQCEFKVGQPVIGVDDRGEWRYDLFSHFNPDYQNGNYICSARSYSKCLPYNEETAHLVGTKDKQ